MDCRVKPGNDQQEFAASGGELPEAAPCRGFVASRARTREDQESVISKERHFSILITDY